jgi:hypothetical protein
MTRCLALGALVGCLAFATAAQAAGDGVSVSVDRASVSTALGHKFSFRSTFTNRSSVPARGLIAHLNVLSLHSDVYVDPEDWSTHRTRFLPTVPPGRSLTVRWPMEAVNHGTFAVYVTLVPNTGAPRPPAIGPAIKISVADRRTLNSGGILPLAVGIPALLGLLTISLRMRRSGRWSGRRDAGARPAE